MVYSGSANNSVKISSDRLSTIERQLHRFDDLDTKLREVKDHMTHAVAKQSQMTAMMKDMKLQTKGELVEMGATLINSMENQQLISHTFSSICDLKWRKCRHLSMTCHSGWRNPCLEQKYPQPGRHLRITRQRHRRSRRSPQVPVTNPCRLSPTSPMTHPKGLRYTGLLTKRNNVLGCLPTVSPTLKSRMTRT